MTVRLRIALTIAVTGLVTAIGVLLTVALAFQRFEHEGTYERANAFVGRVVAMYDDLLDAQVRDPDAFTAFLRNLLLFEPDSQLYLLDADGTVLASSGRMTLPPGFKVRIAPVQQAVQAAGDRHRASYVMGDDPEHMNADAVVAARALRRAQIRPSEGAHGYLYLVCQPPALRGDRAELFRSSLAGPALAGVAALILFATVLAMGITATVTRPLRDLSDAVAAAQRDGFESMPAAAAAPPADAPEGRDEFAQLRAGFQAMLATLRTQWDALRRLDHFRRESVSNLSHDLRSPLTATVACLETLQRRWSSDPARADDQALAQVALRNARNAAQLVRSLGDLALLDEPQFRLQPMTLDLGEVLDDIVMRFADRASRQGVALRHEGEPAAPAIAAVDVELFERAVANLVDNALRFTPAGGTVTLRAAYQGEKVNVTVADSGAGIDAAALPQLFDRLYSRRAGEAIVASAGITASSEGGTGLGLAIVKRIVELHHGDVSVDSRAGRGTTVTLRLPAAGSTPRREAGDGAGPATAPPSR